MYTACNNLVNSSFDLIQFVAVDSANMESISNCSLTIRITPVVVPPVTPSTTHCLRLDVLSIGSPGDLDREHEQIALEIADMQGILPTTVCGLFMYDLK